jgi:hypothetical protein
VTVITGLPLIHGDGIIFTEDARSVAVVTDLGSGIVYKIRLEGNAGTVIGSKKIATEEVITCTVAIEDEVYALSAYLNELFGGYMDRQLFPLTKVVFELPSATATTTDEPTYSPVSSVESLHAIASLLALIFTLLIQ